MDDDILQEFLAESWENLAQLDTEIVTLEKDPSNNELLASIFRTIHTIKGTCGFIGLTGLGTVAHSAENVLGQMREGVLTATPDSISVVLEAVDEIKSLLQGLEATEEEPASDNSSLIARLEQIAASAGGAESASAVPGDAGSSTTPAEDSAAALTEAVDEARSAVAPGNEEPHNAIESVEQVESMTSRAIPAFLGAKWALPGAIPAVVDPMRWSPNRKVRPRRNRGEKRAWSTFRSASTCMCLTVFGRLSPNGGGFGVAVAVWEQAGPPIGAIHRRLDPQRTVDLACRPAQ